MLYMPDLIDILPAGWRDWPRLRPLEKACFGPDAWGSLDLLLALLGSTSLRLKAVADGRVVGFAMAEPHPTEECAWIATLGVHPEFQRKAAALLLYYEQVFGVTDVVDRPEEE